MAAAAGNVAALAQRALAAAREGDAGALSAALGAGAPLSTPGLLHAVAAAPSAAALQLLLDRGADVHAISENRMEHDTVFCTPLHAAVAAGRSQALQLLLSHGADANAADAAGRTPLHLMAEYHIKYESESNDDSDNDDSDDNEEEDIGRGIFNTLIAHGADLHARDAAGDEPIHTAAAHCVSPPILRLLLDAGADPNAPGSGTPPLHLAARYSEGDGYGGREYDKAVQAVVLLLSRGADINLLDADGRRAYHLDGFDWAPEDLPEPLVLLMNAADTRLVVEGSEDDAPAEEAARLAAGARALLIGAAAEVRRLDAARAAAERAQAAPAAAEKAKLEGMRAGAEAAQAAVKSLLAAAVDERLAAERAQAALADERVALAAEREAAAGGAPPAKRRQA